MRVRVHTMSSPGAKGASTTSKKGKYAGKGARNQYRKDSSRREQVKLPQKRFFRQRAHANPFSDHQLV